MSFRMSARAPASRFAALGCALFLTGCGGVAPDMLGDIESFLDDNLAFSAATTPTETETADAAETAETAAATTDADAPEATETAAASDAPQAEARDGEQTGEDATETAAAETAPEGASATGDAAAAPELDDKAAAAAAAAEPETTAAAAAGPTDAIALSYPEPEPCRTVRLYNRPRINVSKKLPEEWRAFAGHWGDGAWDGKLCQELVIDSINEDGKVTLYDMQGYYTPWKRVPTAFRRTGEFLEDGRLRVDLGKMGVAIYELRDDKLYGVYDWGVATARIAMVRKKK